MSFCIGWFFPCPSLPRGFWTCVVTTPHSFLRTKVIGGTPRRKGNGRNCQISFNFSVTFIVLSRPYLNVWNYVDVFKGRESSVSAQAKIWSDLYGKVIFGAYFWTLAAEFSLVFFLVGRKLEHGYLLNDVFSLKTVLRNPTQSRVCTLKWMFMSISSFSWNLRF